MNIVGFSKHQYKRSNTDRYKGCFSTARDAQVIANSTKIFLGQRSKLYVTNGLIFRVLSSSYNVSVPEL